MGFGRRILVADDERGNFECALAALDQDELVYVGDPEDVEKTARFGCFDAILLDLYWKADGRSLDEAREVGYGLLERVKGLAPRVILWTSAPAWNNEERALETGATEFLSKDDIGDLERVFGYPVKNEE